MTAMVRLLFLASLLICCRATSRPFDCIDVLRQSPYSSSGVYDLYPSTERCRTQAYCDMETIGGGWTVIQRRMDGSLNFYRGWDQYVYGFGEANREYWLGLESIHKITARRPQQLLVEMEDFEGNKASARYSSFSVGDESDGYKMTVSGFTDGGAGDSLTHHSDMKFTTFDKDQDLHPPTNCAHLYYGGWWYNNCHWTNPNGVYRWGTDTVYAVGINWRTWKGFNYSVKSFTMKIRPLVDTTSRAPTPTDHQGI